MSDASTPSNALNIVSWVTRLAAVGLLVMPALMKLTGDAGAVYMFEEMLGAPAAARMGLGAVELIVAILILVPKTMPYGAALASLLMVGALGAHFTKLGISIEVPADAPEGVADSIAGPTMFGMAIAVLVSSLVTLFIHRASVPFCPCGNKSTNDATTG